MDGNLLFLFIPILFLSIYPLISNFLFQSQQGTIQVVGFVLIFTVVSYMIVKAPLDCSQIIFCTLIIGIILRTAYAFYTPVYIRQHDVESIDGFGHLGYIWNIFSNNRLPEHNQWQFYQPPLHHILSALWLKYLSFTGISLDASLEGLSVLPLIYSSLTLVVSYKILKMFDLSKKSMTIAFGIIAFHPTFIILAGSINNDMLSIFLMLLAYMYILQWNRSCALKDIVFTAVALALAALTKISTLMLALPIGFIFLFKLFQRNKTKTSLQLWSQYIIFAVISIPIALSHSVYSYIRFEQALGYVPLPGNENSALFVGNYSFTDRFVKPFSPTFFSEVFPNPFKDYNLPEYIIKSSIFGEYSFGGKELMGTCLLIITVVIIALSLLAMITTAIHLIKNKTNIVPILSLYILWITLMFSHVMFNINYPFGCTMDFRYIVPTILVGAVSIGLFYDRVQSFNNIPLTPPSQSIMTSRKHMSTSMRFLGKFISVCTMAFCILSMLFYMFG